MEYVIQQLTSEDQAPYELLLEADPSRKHIDEYLSKGNCRIMTLDSKCIGVYVLRINSNTTAEIMNISIALSHQGRGLGKKLILDAIEQAREQNMNTLVVGTGNSSIGQIAFYQKCGFRIVGIEFDYFKNNYPERIIENGIWCRDLIRLAMNL